MKIQPPPGMRDFYPEDMRIQNWLFDHWRSASRVFGFVEYEGPIFEYLDLYRLKSGEEIVSQLFHFQDRGQREFAIRPEMTPTLARMVAARANSLPRPIKWFSIPRMCRSEKPQRGRLREFYQWNADILGVDDPLADAEVIAVAVEFLRQVGLTRDEVAIRISSRPVAAALLRSIGVAPDRADRAFALIDRHDKLPPEEFARQWDETFGRQAPAARLRDLLDRTTLETCLAIAAREADAARASEQVRELWRRLRDLGVAEYCEFDLNIVRGLAYYTGIIFELHRRKPGLRALLGGGRYDNLTAMLDGPSVPGVGFGMGDAPVLELLSKLPRLSEMIDAFLIDAAPEFFPSLIEIAGDLRRDGVAVDFSYKRQPISKQFKLAAGREARFAVIVGSELASANSLTLKNLGTGEQRLVLRDDLKAAIRS
jgi:histidyl-tRNA synthetase